jgi:hypothetical protein
MAFTEAWQQDEFLRCARSFEYCSSKYFEIRSIEEGAIKFNMYPFQKRVLHEFESHRFNILRKFRQAGLTTLACAWAVWQCMFRENKQILVISKTDVEAVKAGKTAKRILDVLKMDHPWLNPTMAADSKHIMTFLDTRSELEFGGPSRARGQALNLVIIDEAAFIPNMEEIWADMYPTVATGGNVIIVSTVNGIGNWYHKMWVDAKEDRNKFNVIDIHYTEHPKYQAPGWAEEAKSNLGPRLFAQEVLGSFLGSGETYITPEALTRIERDTEHRRVLKRLFPEWDTSERAFELHAKSDDPLLHKWDKGALWIWQEPQEGHQYIMGVDVAEGRGENNDNSAIQVFDMASMDQVAEFCSNKVPPNEFAMVVSSIGVYYNTALVTVESGGPGLAILDKLEHNLYYENIYYHRSGASEKAGVSMNKSSRAVVLEAMQNYLENNLARINSCRLLRELETFRLHADKKRFEAERGHHDDLIMSLAVALYVRDRYLRDVPAGFDLPENMADSTSSYKYEKIKREIENSGPRDWLAMGDDEEDLSSNLEDILPGVILPYDRPHHKLLREFGW